VHLPGRQKLSLSTKPISPALTSFDGTQMGVPCRIIPASTITPATMGSLDLKTQVGRTLNLQGKTTTCLNSSRFCRLRSSWCRDYKTFFLFVTDTAEIGLNYWDYFLQVRLILFNKILQ